MTLPWWAQAAALLVAFRAGWHWRGRQEHRVRMALWDLGLWLREHLSGGSAGS